MKDVSIGEGVIVTDGSVVVKDIFDYSVVGDNPEIVIKYTE